VLPYDTKVSDQSPLTSVNVPDKEDTAAARDRVRQRTLERAAKRFQIVTKEEDWRVANTYVALAASGSSSRNLVPPNKEEKEWARGNDLGGSLNSREKLQPDAPLKTGISSVLVEENADAQRHGASELRLEATERAVDAYLDDDEWEAQERARGRGPSSRLGTTRYAGGRGFSSWLSAWKPEKAL